MTNKSKKPNQSEREEFIFNWKEKIEYAGKLADLTENVRSREMVHQAGLIMRNVLNSIANERYPIWSVDEIKDREA